ncbi:acetyl-CoA carboxylase biotin carboxyl carrier protein subunit [bacterium]|nr:acetyl-CoA carboxylase biotin carboxyl carrier protein subunit [bacterium]
MQKYEITINQKAYSVLVKKFTSENAELEINGKPYAVKLDGPIKTIAGSGQPAVSAVPAVSSPQVAQTPVSSISPQPTAPQPAAVAGGDSVTAPIPGSILEILVKVGDSVETGQTVVKMEAMKMENDINAATSGTVKAIHVSIGDAVSQGQALVDIG